MVTVAHVVTCRKQQRHELRFEIGEVQVTAEVAQWARHALAPGNTLDLADLLSRWPMPALSAQGFDPALLQPVLHTFCSHACRRADRPPDDHHAWDGQTGPWLEMPGPRRWNHPSSGVGMQRNRALHAGLSPFGGNTDRGRAPTMAVPFRRFA